MKNIALLSVFAACVALVASAGPAHAQLDHILAPIAEAPAVPAQETVSTAVQNAAADAAAAKSVATLTADELTGELQQQLTNYFGLKGDLKLSFVQKWDGAPLPAKDWQVTITDYPAMGVASTCNLKFKVTSGNTLVGEWRVDLTAQLWQEVWVADGRLERGVSLDRSMLNVQKVDVLRSPSSYLSSDIDPDNYDVAQGMAAGSPVAKGDVTERPVIHRGEVVDVIATEGALDIRMKALALEDGGVNTLIKMRNLDSNKEFDAQILNENEVRVHF
jgi:flagella basal body P-ring formation protein FlgA